MNQEHEDIDESGNEDDFDDTATLTMRDSPRTDNVGDTSVEINVEELISEVEAAGLSADHLRSERARKRLEDLLEERRMSRDLSDFDDFDLDDD